MNHRRILSFVCFWTFLWAPLLTFGATITTWQTGSSEATATNQTRITVQKNACRIDTLPNALLPGLVRSVTFGGKCMTCNPPADCHNDSDKHRTKKIPIHTCQIIGTNRQRSRVNPGWPPIVPSSDASRQVNGISSSRIPRIRFRSASSEAIIATESLDMKSIVLSQVLSSALPVRSSKPCSISNMNRIPFS